MECTNCGLINPETAERCDCGFDFATQSIKASYFPGQGKSGQKRWVFLLISSAIFVAAGPLVGLISGFVIPMMVAGETSNFTARDWFTLFYFVPPAYVFGAIPALCTGILYGMVSLALPHKILRNLLWRGVLGGGIGLFSIEVYCQFTELNTEFMLQAGLSAGVICGLLPKNCPPDINS